MLSVPQNPALTPPPLWGTHAEIPSLGLLKHNMYQNIAISREGTGLIHSCIASVWDELMSKWIPFLLCWAINFRRSETIWKKKESGFWNQQTGLEPWLPLLIAVAPWFCVHLQNGDNYTSHDDCEIPGPLWYIIGACWWKRAQVPKPPYLEQWSKFQT